MGPSINDVTHIGGREDLPKGDVNPYAHLVKWETRGKGRVKNI